MLICSRNVDHQLYYLCHFDLQFSVECLECITLKNVECFVHYNSRPQKEKQPCFQTIGLAVPHQLAMSHLAFCLNCLREIHSWKTGPCHSMKTIFLVLKYPIIKIRQLWYNLIFTFRIPILVRWYHYIQTASRNLFQNKDTISPDTSVRNPNVVSRYSYYHLIIKMGNTHSCKMLIVCIKTDFFHDTRKP